MVVWWQDFHVVEEKIVDLMFLLKWRSSSFWKLFPVLAYLLVDISLGLTNVDGVTKRRVEKEVEVDGDCGIIVASDRVFSGWVCCKTVMTSDFGTAENDILELLKIDLLSLESKTELIKS